jgi:hypothetical protein
VFPDYFHAIVVLRFVHKRKSQVQKNKADPMLDLRLELVKLCPGFATAFSHLSAGRIPA